MSNRDHLQQRERRSLPSWVQPTINAAGAAAVLSIGGAAVLNAFEKREAMQKRHKQQILARSDIREGRSVQRLRMRPRESFKSRYKFAPSGGAAHTPKKAEGKQAWYKKHQIL